MVSENDRPDETSLPDDTHPVSLFAAYVLHALTPTEEAEVEAYLATHPDAADDLTMLQEAVAMLPYGVPPETPTPQLRLRLMAEVYQDALTGTTHETAETRPVSLDVARTWRNRSPIWQVAAVILLVLTVGFGSWSLALNQRLGNKDQVIATQNAAITSAGQTKPVLATTPGAPAKGELLRLSTNQAAVLTIAGLPPLMTGKVYQVWFIEGSTPVGAGVFSPNPDGSWSGIVRGDVSNAQAIAISVEPSGGSAAPTGDIVAKGSL